MMSETAARPLSGGDGASCIWSYATLDCLLESLSLFVSRMRYEVVLANAGLTVERSAWDRLISLAMLSEPVSLYFDLNHLENR